MAMTVPVSPNAAAASGSHDNPVRPDMTVAGSEFVVTGAGGFIGRALSRRLLEDGAQVTALVRQPLSRSASAGGPAMRELPVADNFKGLTTTWPADLRPRCVIHLAARVHVMNDTATDPLAAFRATNVDGTLAVAEAALRAGVRRFVYVSSIKAVGEAERGAPLRESDQPQPADPYGISKFESEQALLALAQRTGLQVVVVRPPLVYGPGVTANFKSLMRAVARGWPLPLGRALALRSMVGVDNLVDALIQCALHPAAAGQVFHVSDQDDVAVSTLVRRIGQALDRPAKLLNVPEAWLRAAATLSGRQSAIERLFSPLRLSSEKMTSQLGWEPPYSLDEGLRRTAAWYRSECELPD